MREAKPKEYYPPETEIIIAIFRSSLIAIGLVMPRIYEAFRIFGPQIYILITLAVLYNFFILLLYLKGRGFRFHRQFMLAMDICLVTLWIYYTGGYQSTLFALYYLIILVGGIWFGLLGSLVTSSFSAFFFLLVVALTAPPVKFEDVFRQMMGTTVPFLYLVALLAGYLSESLKREREELIAAQDRMSEFEYEMQFAHRIQRVLLPPEIPQVEGVEIGWRIERARHRLSGDYYDVIALEDGSLVAWVADVAGLSSPALAGLPAFKYALKAYMGLPPFKYALKAYTGIFDHPKEILGRLNRRMYEDLLEITRGEDLPGTMFISLACLRLDKDRRNLIYATAGHEPPVLWSSEKNQCIELSTENIVLGVLPEVNYAEKKLKVSSGDILVLYTDGITNAINSQGERFGLERWKEAIETNCHLKPQDLVDCLLELVKNFEVPEKRDDKTVLVIKLST